MADKKIQIMPSNGVSRRQEYKEKPGLLGRLLVDQDFTKPNSRKLFHLASLSLSEMMGTAILVGLGCSGLMKGIPDTDDHLAHLNIILTFGFAITLVVTTFGHISGSHVNPAVSLAGVIFGLLSLPKFLLYVVSQCIGAALGIAAVKLISPSGCTATDFCVTLPNQAVGSGSAMLAEAFTTGILVWVVCAAWDRRCQDKHDSMPIKFGIAVVALALPGAKYSGASLNPARSFGPALLAGNFTDHWVYWLGPMGGSLVACAVYKTFWSEVNPPQAVPTAPETEEEHPL